MMMTEDDFDCSGDDEQALLEFKLISSGWQGAPVSYRAKTSIAEDGNSSNETITTTHFECEHCPNDGVDIKKCLPKNQCHHFEIGRGIGRWTSGFQGEDEIFILKWDGETLRANDAYRFDSIDFGSCKNARRCSQDESEFELFLDRSNNRYPILSWNLTQPTSTTTIGGNIDNNGNYRLILQGEVPWNTTTFVYQSQCVPRNTCLSFNIGYSSDTNTTDWYDPSPYSVRLDGIIYRDYQLRMGLELLGEDKLSETTYLGSCDVATLCNETDGESLFEVQILTDESYQNAYSNRTSSAIPIYNLPWFLNSKDEGILDPLYFDDYELNTTYAEIRCIPNDVCLQFAMGTGNPVTEYTVKENGVELTRRVIHQKGQFEDLTTTGIGCSSSSPTPSSQPFGAVIIVGVATVIMLLKTIKL